MSLTAWRTYLEVCRLGSLSAAAAALGYTQSAVSRQVASLERAVGLPLLDRRARGVAPTAAGEAFRHHARVVVNEADRAVQAARTVGADAPSLTIGATPSLAAGLVPAALRRLQEETGQLRWTLLPALTPELEAMAARGELDVALVTDAPPGLPVDHRLSRQPLGTDEMCVIVPRDHPVAECAATGTPVGLEELAGETWTEDNDGSEALLRRSAARAGFEPRVGVGAADLMGKMALVAAGHAVALVPGVMAPSLRPDVVAVRLVDPPRRGVFASMPAPTGGADRADPLVTRLVTLLRALLERQ